MPARLYNANPKSLKWEESCSVRVSAAPIYGFRAIETLKQKPSGIRGSQAWRKAANRDGAFRHCTVTSVYSGYKAAISSLPCTILVP